eukprot:gene2293-2873_t
MQCSLGLLHQLEPEPKLKETIQTRMTHVRKLAAKRFTWVYQKLTEKSAEEMQMLGPDWRKVETWKNQKGYMNPQWGPYREVWHLTREAGESSLILFMSNPSPVPQDQKDALQKMILRFDYLHNSSCGIIYHLAAYWKARRDSVG